MLSWMKGQTIPIETLDPKAPLNDLAQLLQVVGNASIVGLGEASHGAHEFFVMKHRFLKFLVEKMGFTMFALEADWTSSEPINEYVLTGEGNVKELLARIGYKIWKTEEVLDLLEWMRAYNADPGHVQKVQFAGFDCLLLQKVSLEKIVQFFQAVDPDQSALVADLYKGLHLLSWRSYPPKSIREHYVQAARRVSALLKEYEKEYSQRSSQEMFAAILQEARIVEQVAQQFVDIDIEESDPQFLNIAQRRDAFMAENIVWLHEHAPGGKKMVLWAHNWHIGTWGCWYNDPPDNLRPFTWMGIELRKRYQQQYVSVGFSFFEGAIHALLVDEDGKPLSSDWQPFVVQPARGGSYNEILARVGSCYLVDLRAVPEGEVKSLLVGPRLFRLFDTDYCSDEQRFYHSVSLLEWYDVIVHIHKISPSRLFPPS